MNDELKPCPSCEFDRAKYAEHAKTMRPEWLSPWEAVAPELVPLLNTWYVSCQNCGFTAAWDGRVSKDDTVRNWNQLPRQVEGGGEVRIAKQWTTEALDLTRSLDTNCSEFIDGCSEYIAGLRNHERVEVEDVQCVLDWMESTREVRT